LHVFFIMKCLLTKRSYYHLTRIFNRYHRKFQYTNQENNYSLFKSNDKRLMNILFHEKNSNRFVNCHVCMQYFYLY